MRYILFCFYAVCLFFNQFTFAQETDSTRPVVIAHRGACGYVPEHTAIGKVMACAMGADFIEQDISISKDDRAIVIHDNVLENVTNVEQVFPDRHREDGHYYVVDFTLKEIKKLNVHERTDKSVKARYPGRFPVSGGPALKLLTLEEEIELIQGIEKSTGKKYGLYPELKTVAFYTKEGKDIAKIVLDILDKYGYNKKESNIYVQCFEPDVLKRLRTEFNCKLKLIQLISGSGKVYDDMVTPEGLDKVATYADGIGPGFTRLLQLKDGVVTTTDLARLAHERNLKIHPYTLRYDSLPENVRFEELLYGLFCVVKVDGAFTDFPDKVVSFLDKIY